MGGVAVPPLFFLDVELALLDAFDERRPFGVIVLLGDTGFGVLDEHRIGGALNSHTPGMFARAERGLLEVLIVLLVHDSSLAKNTTGVGSTSTLYYGVRMSSLTTCCFCTLLLNRDNVYASFFA